MLRILTSLSFLYALAILALIIYGVLYYRDFTRGRYRRGRFALVFSLIGIACFFFLWTNIHAPLRLKTFSNLDHQFIQQDGFAVTGAIELGRSDTLNNPFNPYSRFVFTKTNDTVTVRSDYAEEPLYASSPAGYRLLSVNYPAEGHTVSFRVNGQPVSINHPSGTLFELKIGDTLIQKELLLKKGISAWNLFREEETFIRQQQFNDENLATALKNIFLLRDDLSRKKAGALKFFLSGRLFSRATDIRYDAQALTSHSQPFRAALADQSLIAWGFNFLDNNRNQYRVAQGAKDSFTLLSRYPVAYPLSEADRNDWSVHTVNKFLAADGKDLQRVPPVFKEGFLFNPFSDDSSTRFSPMLLSYRKAARNEPLDLQVQWLEKELRPLAMQPDRIYLPAEKGGFNWLFSIQNTYDWQFGNYRLSAGVWQGLLFGSLGIFFLLILFTSFTRPASRLSWVWQLLSCILLLLLTTRFFLYWRYKSFPPFEGMDLPSQQQLQSFANFGIILAATILLALVFGSGFLQYAYIRLRIQLAKVRRKPYYHLYTTNSFTTEQLQEQISKKIPLTRRWSKKAWFFTSWFLLLFLSGIVAGLNRFDPGVCRHIAIAFIAIYFIYLFISYKYSPLAAADDKRWWALGTGRSLDILTSNPVKIFLSVSLLALFVFIDIGFAIVFLNFLLFNEAFLCINYAIAGLSAGGKKNAALFGTLGILYLLFFVLNLLYAPYIFKFLLNLPPLMYIVGYILFAVSIAYVMMRLLLHIPARQRKLAGVITAVLFFVVAYLFFPKERILAKAAMTKYRIDVLTTSADQAILSAYTEGKTYEPVIRAAQNQWFINTFIDEANNPAVQSAGFTLLPHAPQNKGAKYNAQATDLVASRFLVGEHGKWAVLLYVLVLLLPAAMLASFYKLYPDFTNRTNTHYPAITAGFSVLNYLLITALMVILAATGRYIFFGQDLPFGSILSKQSILFPALLILLTVIFFRNIPLENYANRKKLIPGLVVFLLLTVLLFLVKPVFNKNKEFAVAGLAKDLDAFIQLQVQPVLDELDTAAATRRLSLAQKDRLFTDSLRQLLQTGWLNGTNPFFTSELTAYVRAGYTRHLDQRRLLYLDLNSGSPRLSVNDNYFRVEPPPHLQQLWTGNVFGDTLTYAVHIWNAKTGALGYRHLSGYTNEPRQSLTKDWVLVFGSRAAENFFNELYLVNQSQEVLNLKYPDRLQTMAPGDSIKLANPLNLLITSASGREEVLTVEPDAFMRNYYVNGSRYYSYPMAERFTWARNFSEAVASEYTGDKKEKDVFISFDYALMDSLSLKIAAMMERDTAYKAGAEYGICIADGNGRLVALADHIKGFKRPDPNDKAAFNRALQGEEGVVSQSLLRKQIGNINLLRLNPGPGSTLKPIVFSAIASQLGIDWTSFQSQGFSTKQQYYGGMKVAEYDFEKNNGRISNVIDYLKYSDNYYHSNVLLLGSYARQPLENILSQHFMVQPAGQPLHWPWFSYHGTDYRMDGFKNWPGYFNGKADFGSDSSFTSIGLNSNYGIFTHAVTGASGRFNSAYDSLFDESLRRSGFILPETAVFDQQGEQVDHRIAYDLFTSCFRGHVKGSSQVMIPPVKMLEAFGRLTSQNKDYSLTLDPYAALPVFTAFYVDRSISYNDYLSLVKEDIFAGMQQALYSGTAARLGTMLKNGAPYFYYAKTGTTGDEEKKSKSKLFTLVISSRDISHPGFNFRNNPFYTIYFTSQNGPAKQQEEFQAEIVRYVQESERFKRYMSGL